MYHFTDLHSMSQLMEVCQLHEDWPQATLAVPGREAGIPHAATEGRAACLGR